MASLPDKVELAVQPLQPAPRPMLTLVHTAGNYDAIERTAPGVAMRGVHPGALVSLVGLYAAMLSGFWIFFARSPEAALVLVMVTVLMLVYFALVIGGILVADAVDPAEPQRGFGAFLKGRVETLTEVITGKQALMQMLFLPACMAVMAMTIGIIARLAGRVKGHAYIRTSVMVARATLRSEWTPLEGERS